MKSRLRTALRYIMLLTVLAWPVLSGVLAAVLYHYRIQDTGKYRPSDDPGMVFDLRRFESVTTISVFISSLVDVAFLVFVIALFCLVVEGLLLFAMKDDK